MIKKRNRKHVRILVLMITSQILLITFVAQWLRSQYRDERERLADELFNTYLNTQDQLIDTLLFKNYVDPVLSQHTGRAIMIAVGDSLKKDSLLRNQMPIEGSVTSYYNQEKVTIRLKHNGDSIPGLPDTTGSRKVNNDFLLRSVKMIVTHTADSGNRAIIRDLTIHPDTATFRRNFDRRLVEKGMKFNLIWIENDKAHESNRLFINPGTPFSLPGVQVSKYQGFVIKNILPQLIFGIILILITAMAFIFSFRSLKAHVVFNDMRNEFISNMTHELKTPVATISIALESLGKYNMKEKPEVLDEYLRLAISETRRLEDLIGRVLDHSVLEENFSTGNMVLWDINPMLHEITDTMMARLEKGEIEIQEVDESIYIQCDPLLFRGVMINLIDNSIKYCDKVPAIKITTEKNREEVIITVTDNGPGIPSEYQSKIFEKFFRLPSGNVHNVKGYGLGLSFAALVLKLHKGSISVKNNDVGCSFIIRLPLSE